ncbi:trypsin-like serine peptidase [Herbidospora yilanensis]|uniref:trypsin-like serine peptidase n=1 Tax=Herbidospora yilanensis TaxID=354426 RepID=UPI0007C72F58|nr:hypothetical protein [Herbidospora yilanensis]
MQRTLTIGSTFAGSIGLLAAALVASPAAAAPQYIEKEVLAGSSEAQAIAYFWDKAQLQDATPYNVETTVAAKHVSTGGPTADTKAGTVPAIGDEKKSTSTSKNVNLPRTSGKVFFMGADGKPHWCSGTSLQSKYRNLVATAGQCVYDTVSNKPVLNNWVFVPGYYQGKTPWGIYVGKTAYTHYDFDVYEDGDRNYAFVTVYNGVKLTGDKEVDKKTYDKWKGQKKILSEVVTKEEFEAKYTEGGPYWKKTLAPVTAPVDPPKASFTQAEAEKYYTDGVDGVKLTTESVTQAAYNAAPNGTNAMKNGEKCPTWCGPDSGKEYPIDEATYNKLKADTAFKGVLRKTEQNQFFKKEWFVKKWVKTSVPEAYFKDHYIVRGLENVGRLGDNVGGQGLAYNQKLGKAHYVFGYPSGAHPDGNRVFSGNTLKWSYGKTFAAKASAIKGDELVGIKSSFTGQGAIGSSWLAGYKNTRRLGYLNGVTIAVSDRDGNKRIDTSVSAYFDGETYGVYKQAANVWSGSIL